MAGNFSDSSDFDFQGHFMELEADRLISDGESDVDIESSDSEHNASDSDLEITTLLTINNVELSDDTAPVEVSAFIADSGTVHLLAESAGVFDYFSLIVSEDFYELAANQTNLYAVQRQEMTQKVDSMWTPQFQS